MWPWNSTKWRCNLVWNDTVLPVVQQLDNALGVELCEAPRRHEHPCRRREAKDALRVSSFAGVSPAARTTYLEGERERATRAHETSANARSSHMECARMQPDGGHVLAASASHNHADARACSQTAGTITRRHQRTTTRQSFICGGQRKRYLSCTFRIMLSSTRKSSTRLNVLSCDVSDGADLVRQQLHSMLVGAVEVLGFGQQIRPARGVRLVKSVGSVVARRLGALGLPPSVESPPQVDGATNATQSVHDDVHCLHACERGFLAQP